MSINDPLDPSRIRRVLVTKLRHHGDVLLASPVLGALKRHLPEAEIDALVYQETREMLAGHPALSRLHGIRRKATLSEEWRLYRTLRDRGFDLLVHLTSSTRGAWLARLLRPVLSVGPVHGGKFYRNSFTHLYRNVRGNRRHTVENNLDALRRIGIHITEEDKPLLLATDAGTEQAVDAHLQRLGLNSGRFILLHPTSRWLFKCWPEEKVAALAARLSERGYSLLLSGAPDKIEMEMLARIQARIPRSTPSLAGQLTLKQLAALIARARLFIGVDSAPMHIAAAVGTPVVTLFGPSGEIDWGPWRVPSRIITSDHTCRPCGMDGCGGGKRSECLETIPVEHVLAAVLELLEQPR